jgi:hypothetical protein
MPLITGSITAHGAVTDAFVGVCGQRQRLLVKHGFPIPPPIPVRALIDTGASVSGCTADVFARLDLKPIAQVDLLTPSTRLDSPHPCDLFQVSWAIVAEGTSHPFTPVLQVIVADGFHPTERIGALIGRDILARCAFQYWGPDGRFHFSF